jgi:branched-chain amino acid transport system substrate-binding protein
MKNKLAKCINSRPYILMLGAFLFLCPLASAETVKIAIMGPITGSQSAKGIDVQDGAKLALKLRQGEFARQGMDIQGVVFDDSAEADKGVAELGVMLRDPQILGLIGPVNSGVTLKVCEAIAASGAPLAVISPTSATDNLTQKSWNFFSRVIAPNGAQANVAADYIAKHLKSKNVFVISDNQTFGNDLSALLQNELSTGSVKVIGSMGISTPADSKTAAVRVQASKADLLFYAGTHEDGAALLKNLRDAGSTIAFMGGQSLDSPDFVRLAQNEAANVMFVSAYGPISSFGNRVNFNLAFQREYRRVPAARSIFAFDAMNVMLDALAANSKQSAPTRAGLIQAVRKVSLSVSNGVTGAISFTPTGERKNSPMFIMQINNRTLTPDVKYRARAVVTR